MKILTEPVCSFTAIAEKETVRDVIEKLFNMVLGYGTELK